MSDRRGGAEALSEQPEVRLDHIVIAVANLDAAVATFALCFGPPLPGQDDAGLGYGRAIFALDGGRVELCQPLDPEPGARESQASRAFRRRLQRSGEGLHSLAVAVTNLDRTRRQAHDAGAQLIDSEHSDSFFVHPTSMHGVLVQVMRAER